MMTIFKVLCKECHFWRQKPYENQANVTYSQTSSSEHTNVYEILNPYNLQLFFDHVDQFDYMGHVEHLDT